MKTYPDQNQKNSKGRGLGGGVQTAEDIPESKYPEGGDKYEAGAKKDDDIRDHF